MNAAAKAARAVIRLRIDRIDAGDRLRQVDPERVKQIEVSWKDPAVGQLMPIEVRAAGGRFTLISGAHRLAVAISAGDTEIDAFVFEGSDDEVRLREIDENLYRHELTPFDQATFLTERRAIFERRRDLPLLDKSVTDRKSARLALERFINETQEKFGFGRRTVFQALDRRRRVNASLWELLRTTPGEKRGSDIDKLANLPKEKQVIIERLMFGTPNSRKNERRADTLADALAQVVPTTPARTPSQKARRAALLRAWNEAQPADRAALIGAVISKRDRLGDVLSALGLPNDAA